MASVCEICGELVTAADCHYDGDHKYYHTACWLAHTKAAARAALAEEALAACVLYMTPGADHTLELHDTAHNIAARLAELDAK